MPNKISFGQRIATIWQELVEHLNTLSNKYDDAPEREQQQDGLAADAGADGGK